MKSPRARAEPQAENQARPRFIHQSTLAFTSCNKTTYISASTSTKIHSLSQGSNHLPRNLLEVTHINMSANALIDSLKSAKLLPSAIIPESFTPALDLSVKFSSGLAPEHGSLARVSQVKEQPIISISSPPTSSAATYTFMMIDPDAPTPDDPKFGYWRHWVVAAIPSPSATTSPDDITTRGKTLTQYLAPGPKDESGPHRYLFLLFEESAGESLEKADVGGEEFVERRSFRAEELAAKKGLKLVGVQWMRGVGDGWKGGKDEL
jgi:phosphatidylethanolamine-binding protein (PEBP) family uncharacterized protein